MIAERLAGRIRRIVSNLGRGCAIRFIYYRLTQRIPRRHYVYLWPRAAAHPLELRPHTSDLDVFGQIFAGGEYAVALRGRREASVIIDGGANVGYSAAYFLSRYLAARVYAVEPDLDNFAVLKRNLAPYGNRVETIHGALWSRRCDVVLRNGFRDGRSWSRQVQEPTSSGEVTVPAFGVGDIIARAGQPVSILKLDIEGSEAEVFRTNFDEWIELVDLFIVELHDDAGFGSASDAFFAAVDRLSAIYSRSGELTNSRREVTPRGSKDAHRRRRRPTAAIIDEDELCRAEDLHCPHPALARAKLGIPTTLRRCEAGLVRQRTQPSATGC